MPLDSQIADEVLFTCESCGREQGVRALRRQSGNCSKCDGMSWTMTTRFHEGTPDYSALSILLRVAFHIEVNRRTGEIIEIVTSKVPAADALDIAKLGWGYKKGAFHYMELRRELDAQAQREKQKAHGARNCARCGYFFVPAAGKPWTQVGYCSQGCFGSANTAGEVPATLEVSPQPVETKSARTIAVVCKQGHKFEVAAMYAGTFRPCPVCKEKSAVS
jgi:hypothetical protein